MSIEPTDGLRVGIAAFDISPHFHPQFGAWGTTPAMTALDMPLLSRCIAFQHHRTRLVWYGSDLVGDTVANTDSLRAEVASALGLASDQVIWSTSQTHSSGAVPGSNITGASIAEVIAGDPQFVDAERNRLMKLLIEGGREALARLQPVSVSAGRGHCDSMSYNTRFPMPTGGVKFSRHHREGLQSGKYFDPTIGLLRFDDRGGRPLAALFNFCAHPATMINARWISPDWVGTARQHIEEALDGAPAMFVQGMCGDVNCHHIFGTPALARRNGDRLGRAAVRALPFLTPVKTTPLTLTWKNIRLPCRPMYTRSELTEALVARHEFIEELGQDPFAAWFCGVNLPDFFSVEQKIASVKLQIDYLQEGLRRLDSGATVPTSLPLTCGVLRFGDVAAFLSPGENFTATGREIRDRSPFAHTLICGDTNGLFGYIGDDAEIDRGGYEVDSFWKLLCFDGFRLALAKGAAPRVREAAAELLSVHHVGTGP